MAKFGAIFHPPPHTHTKYKISTGPEYPIVFIFNKIKIIYFQEDDDDDDDDDDDVAAPPPEGMYDPGDFENLTVSAEIKELFGDILR